MSKSATGLPRRRAYGVLVVLLAGALAPAQAVQAHTTTDLRSGGHVHVGRVQDPSGDAAGAFDIKEMVVRSSRSVVRVKVSMAKGRAPKGGADDNIYIDPSPQGDPSYALGVEIKGKRGVKPYFIRYGTHGSDDITNVHCHGFRIAFRFDRHTKKFTFTYRVPFRCLHTHAHKASYRTVSYGSTNGGYDRTRKIVVKR